MQRIAPALVSVLILAGLAACSDRSSPAPAPTKSTGAGEAAVPQSVFLASAPADAKDIKATKPTLKQGDTVVLKGRIGGGEEPFVENRAMFTLVDATVPACSDDPNDTCKTPWDYCCVAPDELTANSVTVQIAGADGRPLKTSLRNVRGLKPLATVVAVGKVSQAEGGSVVLDATGLYVAP